MSDSENTPECSSEESQSEDTSKSGSSKENSNNPSDESKSGKSKSDRGPPPPVPLKPPRVFALARGSRSRSASQSPNSDKECDTSSESSCKLGDDSSDSSSKQDSMKNSSRGEEGKGEQNVCESVKIPTKMCKNQTESPLESKPQTVMEVVAESQPNTPEPKEMSNIHNPANVEILISDFDKERNDVHDNIPLIIDQLPLKSDKCASNDDKSNLMIDVMNDDDETSCITGSWEMDEDGTDCSSSCSMDNQNVHKAASAPATRKTTVGCSRVAAATTCAESHIKDQIVVVKLAAKVVHCTSSSSFSVSPRPPPPPPPIPSYPESTDTSSASNSCSEGKAKNLMKTSSQHEYDDDPGKDGNEPGAEETSTSELYQNMVVAHGLMIGKEMDDMEILVQKVDRVHMGNKSSSVSKHHVGSKVFPSRPLTEGKGVDDLTDDDEQEDDDEHCYQNIVVKKGKFAVATKKSNKKSSCDPSVQSVPMENRFSPKVLQMEPPTGSETPDPVVHAVINLPPRKANLIRERRRTRMENLSYQKASRINQLMVAEFKAGGNDRPSSVSIRDGKVMSVTSNNCSELPNSDAEPGSIIGKVKIGFGLNKAKSSLQKSKSVVSNQVEKAGKSMSTMKRKVGSWYHRRVKTPVEQLGAEWGFEGRGKGTETRENSLDIDSIDGSNLDGVSRRSRSQVRSLASTPADFLELEEQIDGVDEPAYSNVMYDRKSEILKLDSSGKQAEEQSEKNGSEDEDSFKTKGQNEFEELRRVVKQGGDFCKDLAAVLQERSELEAQYAKGLSKLSAKLLKASKEATGSVAHAWQAVAVQIDTQAELHRQWSTALAEEVSRPLRNSLETQHKIRKSVEVLVEKTTRNLAEWRTAESKAKRQCFSSSKEFEKLQESSSVIVNNNLNAANSTGSNNASSGANSTSNTNNLGGSNLALAEVRTRSRLLSVPPMEKDPIKLEAKRRKAEEAVRRADIEYYTFCVRSERARLEWESAIRNGSTCLRTLEEEKLSLLRDLAIKYYQYLNELAPRNVQSIESLEEPVKNCSVSQDMHAIVDIRRHAGAEQLLPDFYAEDTSNLMKRERRQEALQKFLYLVNQDLEREKKGAAGIETLAKAIAEAPKIDNAHHDISDKLYYVKSMLLYLEGTRCKVDNALADIEGRQRINNPITQYMRHQRDKQGFPQTILKVPSWAKDECLTFCTGGGSAGSSSPDWNDRGNADGTSGQHETDFDEFSSQDSGCDHNTDSCGEESNKAPSNLISAPSIGKCRAIYDYDANLFDELTIRTGDVINIHDKQEDGWWLGELNGIIGIFPATYVEEVPVEPVTTD